MNVEIADNWEQALEEIGVEQRDVYFSESYVKLYETETKKAKCVVCREGERLLLFPFLQEQIDIYYDFETAYGYGGPITNTEDQQWIDSAIMQMETKLKEEHYICGFVRFHPLLANEQYWKNSPNMEIIPDRKTVYVDTSKEQDVIWEEQISSKNRNMIRKAVKNGLTYKLEQDFDSIEEFIGLYEDTMKRLEAEDFYLFSKEYYSSFITALKGKSFLATIRIGDELVCGAMFMYSERMGHYHLAGSNAEYRGLGANNLLLWETICRMHEMGIEKFHLGGGTDGTPDNSLLKFKTAFSDHSCQFYIGKLILNQEAYNSICERWEQEYPDKVPVFGNRLLKYRY